MTDSVQPLPLPLLRLSRTEAQARTTIAQRAVDLPLQLGASPWCVRLVPLIAPAPLLPSGDAGDAGALLHFEWAGAALALQLPPTAVEQLLSASLDHALLPELPPELIAPVLEAGLADALQALQALGRGAPLRVESAANGAGSALPAHIFDLLLRADDGAEAIAARLYADGLGLLLLAGLLAQCAPQLRTVGDSLPIRLRAEIGCTRVTLDELQTLALGDVVLVTRNFVGTQRTLWLSADGQAGLSVQLPAADAADTDTPDFLTVSHSWSTAMPPVPTDSPADAESADVTATLQTLPVRLSFDLGEVSLSLAQLQALQPGQTLALGHPLTGAVRIRANGALVGEGDLVEIDGQLGVSVRSLFGNSASSANSGSSAA